VRALETAARQHGVVTRGQVLSTGLSPRQLERVVARGVLVPVHRGVYRATGSQPTFEQSVVAASLATRGVASHGTAATLWGMRGWSSLLVEVTVVGRRQTRLVGVVGHCTSRLDPVDVARRGAIPLTSPARTLLDLGAVGTPAAVEAAVEDCLHRRLVTIDQLQALLTRLGRPGRPGVTTLRAVLAVRDPLAAATESVLEDAFVRLLRDAGLPEPARQYPVRAPGRPVLRIDFAYPDRRIAIELDGHRWHSGRADVERDRAKSNLLATLGWRVVRFGWSDVHHRGAGVFAAVAELLRAEGA
jgi:very-short-patch-repair endonuclease